jgi:hypothetical protein
VVASERERGREKAVRSTSSSQGRRWERVVRREEKRRVRKVRRVVRVGVVVVEEVEEVVSVVEIGRAWEVILGIFRDLEGKIVDCFRRAECRSI